MRTRTGFSYPHLDAFRRITGKRPCDSINESNLNSRKRYRRESVPGEKIDHFDSLPDDIIISILCKLSSSADRPAELLNVLSTFYNDSSNAVDEEGHGTHTSAAGNVVKGADFYNIAEGTARGGVPSSRITVYKICSSSSCESANIFSGFDDAISDGVDVITISVGGSDSITLAEDAIAIGSFHAMVNNIVTVNAAGNNGAHGASTIVNLAPWMISVGASSIDRKIIDKVVLGDGRTVIWFQVQQYPEFLSNPFYIASEFNARVCVPTLASVIVTEICVGLYYKFENKGTGHDGRVTLPCRKEDIGTGQWEDNGSREKNFLKGSDERAHQKPTLEGTRP